MRVERLRRRDAHLHVATVGRVEHAVALVDEVALAPVDDADHRRAARAYEVDGAVGVGRRARLRDGQHERVGHVGEEPEPGELGRGNGLDRERTPGERAPERERDALPGDGRGSLTGDDHTPQRPCPQPLDDVGGERLGRQADLHAPVDFDEPAAQRLVERRGRFVDLLQEVVRSVTPIDVACRDLGLLELGLGHGQRRAVVAPPLDPGLGADRRDLALRSGLARDEHGLAVEPEVVVAFLDDAVRLARDHVRVVGDTDVQGLPAAALREQHAAGIRSHGRGDRDGPLESGDRRAECLDRLGAIRDATGHERRDDLRVGRDLRREMQ